MGIGGIITSKWMSMSDICFAFPNEKSFGLFKKLGWKMSKHTFLHYYLIRPFEHPKLKAKIPEFLLKVLNLLFFPLIMLNYKRYAESVDALKFYPLSDESIKEFKREINPDKFSSIRDDDYLEWRFLNSPDSSQYKVCTINNEKKLIIKIQQPGTQKVSIDILFADPKENFFELRKLLATLAVWGSLNEIKYIRMYMSEKKKSSYLRRSLFPRFKNQWFAYYTQDDFLGEALTDAHWDWELLDSDFEFSF